MEIFPVTDDSILQAAEIIKSGGVVAYATETCYGLACDMTNLDAVKKLFAIKNRPGDMPVSALFSSVDEAKKWVEWDEVAEELAEKYLPGPLTIVLGMSGGAGMSGSSEAADGLPAQDENACQKFEVGNATSARVALRAYPRHQLHPTLSGKSESVGLRISSHPIAQRLAELCDIPISTTSANLHGEPNPYSAEEVVRQLENQAEKPDLVLDSGELKKTESSTVVIIKDGRMDVVRQGLVIIKQSS